MADTNILEIEVWIVVDESGDYAIGKDEDEACERYTDDIGGGDNYSKRRIKVSIQVPKPKVLELTGTVPAEAEAAELTVA